MPGGLHRHEDNPFESPIKVTASTAPFIPSDTKTRQPDVLSTADLLLEQLRELENLCSTVEERVQHKRKALKALEYLVFGSNSAEESPRSPVCPANTPINSRLRFMSPRLRGLFDLRGPGQANLDATQSCLDYSPEAHTEYDVSTREEPGYLEDWVDDDDEEALLSGSPFDDKFALPKSPRKTEKQLPAVPHEEAGEVPESKIPRKVYVRRDTSTSRRLTGRPLSAVMRSNSHQRGSSVRGLKATHAIADLATKGTMRRGSWKRSILGNVKTKGSAKVSVATENEGGKSSARKKERRKGLWSIYSVRSELGLSGVYHAI